MISVNQTSILLLHPWRMHYYHEAGLRSGEVGSVKIPIVTLYSDVVDKFYIFCELQACCFQQVIKYVVKLHGKGEKVAAEVAELFSGELNPVAPKAQRKVPVPEG